MEHKKGIGMVRTKQNEHCDRWQIVQNKKGSVGFLNQGCGWEMATYLPIDGRDSNCAHIAGDDGWQGAIFCCLLNWHLIVISHV